MNLKNILLSFAFLSTILLARTDSWGLDITAQAQNNSGEMIGISDYIRIKMQNNEPFEDCGIDRCCDKFENGNGGCLDIENENYTQGDDPNGDNFNPLTDTGYERNGQWDGDIFNDSNQDCSYNSSNLNSLENECEDIENEDSCLDDGCNWNNDNGCYYCIYLENENSCIEVGCNWNNNDGCSYDEAFIDRVGQIGFTFGPDGQYTKGEKLFMFSEFEKNTKSIISCWSI